MSTNAEIDNWVFCLEPNVPEFYAGRAFEFSSSGDRYPGVSAWPILGELLANAGIKTITIDTAETEGVAPDRILLGTHCKSLRADTLLRRGARGAFLFCWESPIIAWEFYAELPKLATSYRSIFLFPGMAERLRGHPDARPAFVPLDRRAQIVTSLPWESRSFLGLVNSNNRSEPVSPVNLARTAILRTFSRNPINERPSLRRQIAGLRDPSLGHEIYSERLKAIDHFVSSDDFGLFGRGWDNPATTHHVLAKWRGPVVDKLRTLSDYKFALCYENTEFPGYITEKLFDGLFAGCIPVYRGAPDVDRYVPAEAFVDARQFTSYRELELALRSMSPEETTRRREAGREFLLSEAFEPFHVSHVARAMFDAVMAAR